MFTRMSRPLSWRREFSSAGTVARLLGLTLLMLAGSVLACGGDAGERTAPRGVVLITVEALRVGPAMSAQGEGGDRLRALAENGLAFARAYSPSSLAQQSMASLFVGRLPTRAGAIGVYESQPPPSAPTLSTRLRRAGVQTALVSDASWASREGFTRGFDSVEVAPDEGWSLRETVDRAKRSLEVLAGGEDPFLLAVHVEGPAKALPRGLSEVDESGSLEAADLASGYETAVSAALDDLVPLLDAIDSLEASDDVLVALLGTNGYELLEHGGLGSGWTVFEESVAVPLLLRWRARIEPAFQSAPVSTLGLTAMLIDLFSGTADPGELDAQSIVALEGASYVSVIPVEPPIAEVAVREWAISRAVIGERHKYIHTTKTAPPLDRAALERGIEELQAAMLSGSVETPELFGRPVEEFLFELPSDPAELSSVLDQGSPELAGLRRALRAYRDLCETDAYAPLEITRRLEIDPDQVLELESLGYL